MNEKMKSRKFIFTVWAALTFSALGVFSLMNDSGPSWLSVSMPILVGIVGAYVGIGKAKEKGE